MLARASLASLASAVTQTVKEVMQSLVDDSLVELEKVGAKNFFWAFPSKALRQVRVQTSPSSSSSSFLLLPSVFSPASLVLRA